MNHSFNVEIASKYGMAEAVLLENIYFWIQKNKANQKHFYDGSYWTYNSVLAFTEIFPYLTKKQVERVLNKLETEELIKTGNYNKVCYDRTKWYSVTEKGESILLKREIKFREKENQIPLKGKPIPYINTDIKTDIYKESPKSPIVEKIMSIGAKIDFEEVINYLNLKTGKNFKLNGNLTKKLISCRWQEGFDMPDFKKVIDIKCAEWNHEPLPGKEDMRQYLRPQTLFSNKFEAYLNQEPTKAPCVRRNKDFGKPY